MQSFFNILLATAVILSGANAALGDVIFTENFNTDHTANWTTNNPGVTDIGVDYFYDYSAIGVSAAPGGAGTVGRSLRPRCCCASSSSSR